MRIALCNEVIAPMSFPKQCEYAAKLKPKGARMVKSCGATRPGAERFSYPF